MAAEFSQISGDGQLVVFKSPSFNLVQNDNNNLSDIFLANHSKVELVQSILSRVRRSDKKTGFSLVAGKDLVARVCSGLIGKSSETEAVGELCIDQNLSSCDTVHLIKSTAKT